MKEKIRIVLKQMQGQLLECYRIQLLANARLVEAGSKEYRVGEIIPAQVVDQFLLNRRYCVVIQASFSIRNH